uniref:Uncharacterized protein n=1 Tax=viral metagenome TaxID=1070528 RepID=A0A6H1ZDC3_9ZZZZ
MADNDGNGEQKVTVAILGHKMDALTKTVSEAMDDAKEDRKAQAEVNRDINTRVTRLEERIGIWGAFQAVYSTGVAAIAAWIGAKK